MIDIDHFDNPQANASPHAWNRIIRTRTAFVLLNIASAVAALIWARFY